MRASKVGSRAGFGAVFNICRAGALVAMTLVASTQSVSLQDIIALTNTRSSDANRWLAHLVVIPSGSIIAPAANGKGEFSTKSVTNVMGVQTREALHVLDVRHILESGNKQTVNRAMMGDRIFTPEPVAPAALSTSLLTLDTMVSGSVKNASPTQNPIFSLTQTFQKPQPELVADAAGRTPLPKGEMRQARAVARQMARVMEKIKRDETLVAANPALGSSTVSYAPQDTAMASAFAAVLRPTLKKPTVEEKDGSRENGEALKKKSGLKKAVAALQRSTRRAIIRLGRGDHKWAANSLPRNSSSRAQRRCLAAGVYFEARSEPKKGQQAVAQVILNRVKNPSYPNTICGVVYQNKWKRNACQFSFACDGIRDKVNSPVHWKRSVKVANAAIDGRVWLRSVGSASHYHADYVWPKWRRKMRRMTKIGRHIFYRTYGGGWS